MVEKQYIHLQALVILTTAPASFSETVEYVVIAGGGSGGDRDVAVEVVLVDTELDQHHFQVHLNTVTVGGGGGSSWCWWFNPRVNNGWNILVHSHLLLLLGGGGGGGNGGSGSQTADPGGSGGGGGQRNGQSGGCW